MFSKTSNETRSNAARGILPVLALFGIGALSIGPLNRAANPGVPDKVVGGGLAPVASELDRSSKILSNLCEDFWQSSLQSEPILASNFGEPGYDAILRDISPTGIQLEKNKFSQILERTNRLDTTYLNQEEQLTRSILLIETQRKLDRLESGLHLWNVSPLEGPQIDVLDMPILVTIGTFQDGKNYLARCRAIGPHIDQIIHNLRNGKAEGKVATSDVVGKVIQQIDELLEIKLEDWPLAEPLAGKYPGWTEAEKALFQSQLKANLAGVVIPSFKKYREFLSNEILPASRSSDRPGLYYLPGGQNTYRSAIRASTSLALSPEYLMSVGLEELQRNQRQVAVLGGRLFGTGSFPELREVLRKDAGMRFETAGQIEHAAKEALRRAKQEMPKWFLSLPKNDCIVKSMALAEAPGQSIAYYLSGAPDGSRPAYFMYNPYKPQDRLRTEIEAVTFHEAIPGHHLQVSIAEQIKDIPKFRRFLGDDAYFEGWALYAETLAGEMGIYSGDLAKIGMYSAETLRSARLIVDTGIHFYGWSKKRAVAFMTENTTLSDASITIEVDRYIANPGQALSYKVGQLEILKLRESAKRALGADFDIREFHHAILGKGNLPLPALKEQIERYILDKASTTK